MLVGRVPLLKWTTEETKSGALILTSALEGLVDGQNPAPPKKPSNDDWPVNANKQWLPLASEPSSEVSVEVLPGRKFSRWSPSNPIQPLVSKLCEMSFATIRSSGQAERLLEELGPAFALVQRTLGKDSQQVPQLRREVTKRCFLFFNTK